MAGQPEHPTLLELFCVFLRISTFTIGGGYVMFPVMKREVVDDREWISDEQMVDYYALGQSIPGIIAMNTSTLIGYRTRGVSGAIVSAVGMALPSMIVILLIVFFLTPYFDQAWVQKAFSGIRAAVVAMLVMAVWEVGKKSVTTLSRSVIALGTFLAIIGWQVNPVLMILTGAFLGLVLFRQEEKK